MGEDDYGQEVRACVGLEPFAQIHTACFADALVDEHDVGPMKQCFLKAKIDGVHHLDVDTFGAQEVHQWPRAFAIGRHDQPLDYSRRCGYYISRRTFIRKHSQRIPSHHHRNRGTQ